MVNRTIVHNIVTRCFLKASQSQLQTQNQLRNFQRVASQNATDNLHANGMCNWEPLVYRCFNAQTQHVRKQYLPVRDQALEFDTMFFAGRGPFWSVVAEGGWGKLEGSTDVNNVTCCCNVWFYVMSHHFEPYHTMHDINIMRIRFMTSSRAT